MAREGAAITGWLRRKPTTPADGRVKKVFLAVAGDPRFQLIAGLVGDDLRAFLDAVEHASFRYATVALGWAGLPEEEGGPFVLGLSPLHLRTVPAAHELFHLARHVRNLKQLDDETHVWHEEQIVWGQTFRYKPVRTFLEMFLTVVLLTALVLGPADLLFRWLFGEGLFATWARLLQRK